MNGFPADDRALEVSIKEGEEQYHQPIPEFPPAGTIGAPLPEGVRAPPGGTVFIFHLPPDWGRDELAYHFTHCGTIVDCQIMYKPGTSESKGFGFVGFQNPASAQKAVEGMMGFRTP